MQRPAAVFSLFVALTFSCASSAVRPQAAPAPSAPSTTLITIASAPSAGAPAAPSSTAAAIDGYSYADGSGNRYSLDLATKKLTYTPVRKAESSSGIYDGGPAWHSDLSTAEMSAFVSLFKGALAETEGTTAERAKGTGLIRELPAGKEMLLLTQAPSRMKLEAALRGYSPKPKP